MKNHSNDIQAHRVEQPACWGGGAVSAPAESRRLTDTVRLGHMVTHIRAVFDTGVIRLVWGVLSSVTVLENPIIENSQWNPDWQIAYDPGGLHIVRCYMSSSLVQYVASLA